MVGPRRAPWAGSGRCSLVADTWAGRQEGGKARKCTGRGMGGLGERTGARTRVHRSIALSLNYGQTVSFYESAFPYSPAGRHLWTTRRGGSPRRTGRGPIPSRLSESPVKTRLLQRVRAG